MKIYQIHCSGGMCGDDSYDYIVSTYLNKQKAYDRCDELNQRIKENNKQAMICYECDGSGGCTKKEFERIDCKYKVLHDEDYDDTVDECWCSNCFDFDSDYYDNVRYFVEEEDVIE